MSLVTRTAGMIIAIISLSMGFGVPGPAHADEVLRLVIKNHQYQPDHLDVPADVKFKILVKNDDDTAEEFESFDLNREKLVPPGQEITVFLGPLDKGNYGFFGDFHQDTAKGTMTAK